MKKIKKTLVILSAFFLISVLFSITVTASDSVSQVTVLEQGKLSEEISWTFDNNGTLSVYGKGYIGDFASSSYAPWYRFRDDITSVVIGEGITGIGRENFCLFKNIKSVSLPKTLSTIGEYAFFGCESLEEINLPEGLATIASHAFYACESLKEFHIPSTTYYVNEWALFELSSLEKFSVASGNTVFSADENGVLFNADKTHLMKYPLSGKSKTYTIPESVVRIDPQAFNGANYLEEVIFPEESPLERIETATFANSAIKKIVLPKGLRFIDANAFSGCSKLYDIELPEKLELIYDYAFSMTSISEITLPSSLVTIGNSAFWGCENLREIVIPEGVTAVGTNAFMGCESLEKIQIPASLTWIDLSGYSLPKLEAIVVSQYNYCYSTDEVGAVYYKKDELVWYPGLSENTTYKVADGTTKIGKYVFNNAKNLCEVILPSTLNEISWSAFEGCNLSEITIPSSVKTIDTAAFRYCKNLTKVTFEQGTQLDRISNYAFANCTALKEFHLPDSVTGIGNSAFLGCTLLESFYVGENSALMSIPGYTFSDCPFVCIFAPVGSVAYNFAKSTRIDNRVKVIVDGKSVDFELYPTITNGRTLIPVSGVFELFRAEFEFDAQTGVVTIKKGETEISITTDSDIMKLNGTETKLDCMASVIADIPFVPIRAVSEAFGYEVSWDDSTRTVIIMSK